MSKRILVTGGAGFIGSHLVDLLIENSHEVKVLDNFEYQVHKGDLPDYLNPKAKYMVGDMRNKKDVKEAIKNVDLIAHQASAVGVGQSMYKIAKYANANVTGTANLLDVLVNEEHGVEKLVVASSMSYYGEGAYQCRECGEVYPKEREERQMKNNDWEQKCPNCGKEVTPKVVDEY